MRRAIFFILAALSLPNSLMAAELSAFLRKLHCRLEATAF